MKPYIYITRRLPEQAIESLSEIAEVGMWPEEEMPVPKDVLRKEAKRAAGLFTMVSDNIDAEVIEAGSNLKVIANMAVGYDNIDVELATEKGIYVCHTPDVLTDTTADLTFGLLMATARRLVEAANYVKEGKWRHWSPLLMAGHDIHHKTIGIVGMGRIGETVAKRATGFDMEILYHNRTRKQEAEESLGARYCGFNELLERSDFVVSLAPLTEETKGLFSHKAFARMKETAIFINAGRGPVVNEQALARALDTKQIAAAGLDVFATEPIGADHPLLRRDNVVAIPHIGSASAATRMNMAELTSRNIIQVFTQQRPEACINRRLLEEKGWHAPN